MSNSELAVKSLKLSEIENQARYLYDEEEYAACAGLFETIFRYKKIASMANNIGVARRKSGETLLAIKSFHQAIALKPDYATAYYNLACTLIDVNDLLGAKLNIAKAIDLNSSVWQYHSTMGNLLQQINSVNAAIISYNRALEIHSENPLVLGNLARCMIEINAWDRAEALYQKAISLEPDDPIHLHGMGMICKNKGDFSRAIDFFSMALNVNPNYISCLRSYCSIPGSHINISLKEKLSQLSDEVNLSKMDQSALSYALFDVCDNLGLDEEAFCRLSHGAKLRSEILEYNISDDKIFFEMIKELSEGLESIDIGLTPEGQYRPIFIVGMPRSGTTLVEQIISSSSKVEGFGELKWLPLAMSQIQSEGKVSKENIFHIRNYYLARVSNLSPKTTFFTDKMPFNFRFIPFILKAFPEAKIVHVYRDAAATCWSNYSNYFSGGGVGYSYDLKDCEDFFGMYVNLMNGWQSRFNKKIFNLDYDKLVASHEDVITDLYSFLGLELTNSAFTPEKNKNPVKTVSSVQVKQPIYAGSSAKWLRYQSLLGKNFSELKKFDPDYI